jgi:hypothetical protein
VQPPSRYNTCDQPFTGGLATALVANVTWPALPAVKVCE